MNYRTTYPNQLRFLPIVLFMHFILLCSFNACGTLNTRRDLFVFVQRMHYTLKRKALSINEKEEGIFNGKFIAHQDRKTSFTSLICIGMGYKQMCFKMHKQYNTYTGSKLYHL